MLIHLYLNVKKKNLQSHCFHQDLQKWWVFFLLLFLSLLAEIPQQKRIFPYQLFSYTEMKLIQERQAGPAFPNIFNHIGISGFKKLSVIYILLEKFLNFHFITVECANHSGIILLIFLIAPFSNLKWHVYIHICMCVHPCLCITYGVCTLFIFANNQHQILFILLIFPSMSHFLSDSKYTCFTFRVRLG